MTIWGGAIVVGNARVGKGAVVGANSVVVWDVPPGCTVMGNPACVVFWRQTKNGD